MWGYGRTSTMRWRRPANPAPPSAPPIEIDAAHETARAGRGVVQREESKAAADVEHGPRRGEILADLVEEALAQDREPGPAVGAHDGIVVRADDATNRVASHRSDNR